MRVAFKKSFLKELKKLEDKTLKTAIYNSILQVEDADSLEQVKNLKKLKGYDVYYRIRVGDYRLGLKIESSMVYFVVVEHRKDIYKRFP
jgi:mRNA interferase RelE/StbE